MTAAAGVARQDGPAVRDSHLVDVRVDDVGAGAGLLSDLVHVALGRDARADVKKLADPARGQESHRAARNARLAQTPSRVFGSTATIALAASWSARKLWLPPSQ